MPCLRNRVLLLGLCLAGILSSCSRQKDEPTSGIDQIWAPFVSSVSDGEISRKGPVRIRFVHSMVSQDEIGKAFKGSLKLEPSVDGAFVWENTSELVLVPKVPLAQGKEYVGRLSPAGLDGVPSDLGDFVFEFSVVKQSFKLEWTGFSPMGGDDSTLFAMEGAVKTTDKLDTSEVRSFLQARQAKTKLVIAANLDAAEMGFDFRILDVRRLPKRSEAHLTLNPRSIGMDAATEERDVPVPGLDEFDVLFARLLEGPTQGVRIQFTDPLSPQADLASLVHLGDISPLRFEIQGSRLDIFLPHLVAGEETLLVDQKLTNRRGASLGKDFRQALLFQVAPPSASFIGQGVILPDAPKLTIPIEAASLREITVEAMQIYASNMGQFFQVNNWDGDRESRRVGRVLWRKRIKLVDDTSPAPRWKTRYAIDVSDLVRDNPGSLFRLKLKFARDQAVYPCPDGETPPRKSEDEPPLGNYEGGESIFEHGWRDWSEDGEGDGEENSDADNPCFKEFYERAERSHSHERNLIASNIGIVAKSTSDGNMVVATSSLRTAETMGGTEITVFNFQNQPIGTGTTGGDGLATFKVAGQPFYLRARKGTDVGYLKLLAGGALPVAHFDVGGAQADGGVKGFLFGERGVWRPGDSLFLTLAIEDRNKTLPAGHPIRFELHDPQGRLFRKEVRPYDPSGFHVFRVATAPGSPTGTWMASATLGDRRYEKALKIETVKPNRLDVQLQLGSDTLWEPSLKGVLRSQWLQGASAQGLKAEITAVVHPWPVHFTRYPDHIFDDPSRTVSTEPKTVFEGTIGSSGKANIEGAIEFEDKPSSALKAVFKSQVFEEGGDASVERIDAIYHPYARYVGLALPKGPGLGSDSARKVSIVLVDPHGRSAGSASLHAKLTQIDRKWWWELNDNSPAMFERSDFGSAVLDTVIAVRQGAGSWPVKLPAEGWAKYFLEVCDEDQGHCAGKIVTPGSYETDRDDSQAGDKIGATMLAVRTDKATYTAGQTAILTFPSGAKGRALVSLESGSRILRTFWTETKAGATRVEIPITPEMAPGIYASVTEIQPHEDRRNDLPMRLYGIAALRVEDPSAKLEPVIGVPSEIRPDQTLQVHVKEGHGHAMTYTLALVDEGLLGITRYKTPDILSEFRQKEALGVRTWDLYDWVVGAYGGEIERLLSLGGDQSGSSGADAAKANRFPPLVRHLGPFRLESGKEGVHSISLPEYVGKVRVMVVAGADGAWGSGEAQVFVRKPLMLLPTLPRSVRPGEEIDVPVTVFAMKDNLGSVQTSIDPGTLEPLDGRRRDLSFRKAGESMVKFRLKVPSRSGVATLRFSAKAGSEEAVQTVNLPVVPAGSRQVEHSEVVIQPGKSWSGSVAPFGIAGTRKGLLEISSIPRLGLESRLQELIGYPYGCLEQTTSGAFPQLLLGDLVQLDKSRQDEIRTNVKAALARIHGSLQVGGALGYWPKGEENEWASLWAGHFVLEASARGYEIPGDLLNSWRSRQKGLASRWWRPNDPLSAQHQAYRLFLLALGGAPDLAAMNRLGGVKELLTPASSWLLGAAYGLVGQAGAATPLIPASPLTARQYLDPGPTFGSEWRDKAIAGYALAKLGRADQAQKQANQIAEEMAKPGWQSTQTLAWSLLAISSAYAPKGTSWTARAVLGSRSLDLKGTKALVSVPVDDFEKSNLLSAQLTNTGTTPLFAHWILSGIPEAGQEKEVSNGVKVEILYTKNDSAEFNPRLVSQGADFKSQLIVTNLSGKWLDHLAVSYFLPSGWEVQSARLDGQAPIAGITYQDVRDDRVLTFLNLPPGGSRKIPLRLHASYLGKFQLPGTSVEAMYDGKVNAYTKGTVVSVVP